jgi:hypothetical protein
VTIPADQKDSLERLAARIADDEPVDWRVAADEVKSIDDPALQGLRELEQVVHGFRHAQMSNGKDTPRSSRFRFGALTVVEPIGSGSQGEVWRAYDPLLDLHVALKLRKLESGTLAHQFLEEARHLARVRQANIVSVYGAAVHDGRAGMWTELIRGTSLADLLAQHGTFPADEVRGIGLDLCHALAAVHRHGLLHGDIKSENVMREVSGRIVLMDFGAARELDRAQSSVVSGSLHYLAPEVLRGASPSVASDIYALGVLLFRLLTGTYPHTATDLDQLLRAHEGRKRTSLAAIRADVPKALIAAIDTALQSDPAKRHASALAFAAALSAPPSRPIVAWRVFGAVIALAAIALLAWIGFTRQQTISGVWQADLAFRRAGAALTDGASIALGDKLSLAFHSNHAAYVYVFNDDGSGEAAVLFPLPNVEPANPLGANTDYQLPGRRGIQTLSWQVSSNAEREQFIVIASDQPQPKFDAAIAAWRRAGENTSSRGALALAPASTDAEISSVALRNELDKLAADDVHIRRWRFTFPHPRD